MGLAGLDWEGAGTEDTNDRSTKKRVEWISFRLVRDLDMDDSSDGNSKTGPDEGGKTPLVDFHFFLHALRKLFDLSNLDSVGGRSDGSLVGQNLFLQLLSQQ